jgi:hypothetical protein
LRARRRRTRGGLFEEIKGKHFSDDVNKEVRKLVEQ